MIKRNWDILTYRRERWSLVAALQWSGLLGPFHIRDAVDLANGLVSQKVALLILPV
jgi:hypothetical protein